MIILKTIRRIFVNLPTSSTVELGISDRIFLEPVYTWINHNNVEDYIFLDVIYEGIEYKLPISDFKFMY